MPPAIGGMATVLQDLQNSSLAEQVQLEFFNTFKTTADGRSLFCAVKSKLSLWMKWGKLLQGKQKTVVHIHTCSGFTFFLDSILICIAKCFSRPVVLHIHGGRFIEFLDNLSPVLFKLVSWVFHCCNRVVVLSDYWQNTLSDKFSECSFSIVENGVPIKRLVKKQPSCDAEIEILFLGNLTKLKGVFDLIVAMKYIDGAMLNFVGGEEDAGIFQDIEKLLDTHHLQNKVKIHGPQYGEAKNIFLNAADIFVLPSYAEGLPISLLEAMANALPVVVSPVGGIPSVITDQQEGLLVKPGQVDDIVKALNALVRNDGLRKEMGLAGRKRCEEQFGIEKTVGKLLNIYSEVI